MKNAVGSKQDQTVARFTSEVDVALAQIAAGALPSAFETETLDFKEEKQSSGDTERMIAEAAICFANAAGGIVALGVADKIKGKEALIGAKIDPVRVKQRVYELTRPHLNVEAFRHETHPQVIIIVVPQSSDVHSDTQGRTTRRINTDCLPMSAEQQLRLKEERRGFDWSSEPSNLTIADIPDEAFALARKILSGFNDDRRNLVSLSNPDLLSALGLLTDRIRLNRAGALLFAGPEPGQSELIVYQYRATPGGEPTGVGRLNPPMVLAFSRLMDLVSARQSLTPVTLPSGQQIAIEDFPQLAVREALSNAMCHRDYNFKKPVFVDHSPAVFLVNSAGPLVSGVTTSNILTTTSRPRNPCLAKAARIIGFAEELGRGVDRMYREMIRSGRPLPRIEAAYDEVKVALVGGAPDTNIARYVLTLPEEEQNDTDTMLVLFRLCSVRTVTANSIAGFLQKSPPEVETILRRLASDQVGLLEMTRPSSKKSASVFRLKAEALKGLGAVVSYHRKSTGEIDKKVIAHVREYGKLTNKTLQNIFDIHVYKARDIISDLVQRGVLTRVSEQQRGTRVEWGPGPNFPLVRSGKARSPKGDQSLSLTLWDLDKDE